MYTKLVHDVLYIDNSIQALVLSVQTDIQSVLWSQPVCIRTAMKNLNLISWEMYAMLKPTAIWSNYMHAFVCSFKCTLEMVQTSNILTLQIWLDWTQVGMSLNTFPTNLQLSTHRVKTDGNYDHYIKEKQSQSQACIST